MSCRETRYLTIFDKLDIGRNAPGFVSAFFASGVMNADLNDAGNTADGKDRLHKGNERREQAGVVLEKVRVGGLCGSLRMAATTSSTSTVWNADDKDLHSAAKVQVLTCTRRVVSHCRQVGPTPRCRAMINGLRTGVEQSSATKHAREQNVMITKVEGVYLCTFAMSRPKPAGRRAASCSGEATVALSMSPLEDRQSHDTQRRCTALVNACYCVTSTRMLKP